MPVAANPDFDPEYFNWLVSVCMRREDAECRTRLMFHLFQIPFVYILEPDRNRFVDGLSMRSKFSDGEVFKDSYLILHSSCCSILEMMAALAVRCETDIMYDPEIGNRTSEWFRIMLANLGVWLCTDDVYDPICIDAILNTFLYRRYQPDGTGGNLFCITENMREKLGHDFDMRKQEIWYQMNFYLREILRNLYFEKENNYGRCNLYSEETQ